jgi:hypothetical protein
MPVGVDSVGEQAHERPDEEDAEGGVQEHECHQCHVKEPRSVGCASDKKPGGFPDDDG